MKNHQASISDIAKALGVSPSTVSRALRDHPDISPDTRQRIHEYASSVNYRPNALAVGLKHHRSFTLGIIVPEIVHHFFSTVISGIEDIAYGKGYRVMICQSNEDQQREMINMQALLDHRVDGLLVSHSKSTTDFTHFRWAVDSKIPIVFFDRFVREIPSDRVITNDYKGAWIITTHLIDRGCRNILHLAAPQHFMLGMERSRGHLDALNKHGIRIREDLILQCDTPAKVIAEKDRILKLAGEIDGVYAVNDFTAIAAMKLLQTAGYNIPDQIAVTGFGDDPIATIAKPNLTTIEQKGFDMGREAVRMLINRLEHPNDNIPFETKVFPGNLVIRESA